MVDVPMRPRWQKTRARVERQERFLHLIRLGVHWRQACSEIGMSRQNYFMWRKTYPEFRYAMDEALASLGGEGVAPHLWDGGFISGRRRFFGMETFWHQREIVHAIEQASPGEVVLVLVAPETGKTTLLEDKMSIEIGQNPNTRICYVTESLARTRKICGRLKRRMTNREDYLLFHEQFGPFYELGQERNGKPWSADFFTVAQADHDERDYSFEGRGWRSAVAGTRTDTMYLDDIQSLRSLNQTRDIVARLRQDFFSRPGREGVIVVTGTRVGIGDVYEEMWEQSIVSERNTIRLPMVDAQGHSLCPELWPDDALEAKRLLVGEDAWWRNYMQKPRHSMDAAFTEAMLDGCMDALRALGTASYPSRVATLDPALAGGNALGVFSYDERALELVDFEYRHNVARVEEIILGIERMATRHHFADLVIETNAFQRGLLEDERLREIARRHGFRVHPHQTQANKIDAELGVGMMPSAFIRGEIRLPGAPESSEAMRAYVDQHVGWRANVPTKRRVQDLVMMQWFAWLFWERRRKTMSGATALGHIHRPAPFRVRGAHGQAAVARRYR